MELPCSALRLSVLLVLAITASGLGQASSPVDFCIHDVRVVAITAPRGTVDSGIVLTPRAIVRNVGDFNETFPVTLWVANGYGRTIQCTLAIGQTDTVEFVPDWVGTPVGSFATTCFSSLGSDQNRRNDTIRDNVEVVRPVRRDVGTVAVLSPVGVFDSGVVVVPSAVVRNFGSNQETFPVLFSIGDGYRDSVTCSLMPDESDTVTFMSWVAQPVGRHEPRCLTCLPGDQNRQNDTVVAEDSVEVVTCRHDVGVTAILAPTDTVDSGALVTPCAVIRNFGDRQDTFSVTFQVGSSYSSTLTRVLAPLQTDTVEFAAWPAGPLGRLITMCFTSLAADQYRGNDTVRSFVDVVRPKRHDVAAKELLAPTGSVDSGTLVAPRAVVRNLGDYADEFPVTLDIGDSYSETVQCALGAGQLDTVAFPLWSAAPVGNLAVTCYTSLAGDEDRSNDTVRTAVEVVACRHDVGVVLILAPRDTVDSGTVHTPSAVVHNFGDRRETFPVSFQIGPDYAETIERTLEPGATDTVRFPDWIAGTVGTLSALCFSELGNDMDRTNDTAYAIVAVAVPRNPDVGAVSIVWPRGMMDSGVAGTPAAVVANYGSHAESFPVTLSIGSVWRDSASVQLAAGETTEVRFRTWVAQPVGQHHVLCHTQLADDRNRANDTARAQVCVVPLVPPRRDVGAVEILAPTGSVVLGSSLAPRARVGNFGDSTEVFPVTFEIEPAYSATVTCTLAPARTATVSFPTWTAGPLGLHATTCYTSLGPDNDRSNDTVTNSVQVVPPSRRDVGVIAIMAPADTVDSGSAHTPGARVTNSGDRAETFPVTFHIGSQYSHTLPAVTLNPGDTTTLYFQSWTAAQSGSFSTTCYTGLDPDEDRSNDTAYGSVVVRPPRYDVGAIAILAPADTVDSGTVIAPVAVVHRFARELATTEPGYSTTSGLDVTFPVTMAIGGLYRQTVQVTMSARGIDTVRFDTLWTAQPPGFVRCTCYTSLAQDPNRSNDTVCGLVVVRRLQPGPRHDVAVIAIQTPADTVDSGSVHTPSAKLTNLGNRTETFPATFRIGTGYFHTLPAVTLNPGDTTVLHFQSWTASRTGTFPAICYTELAADEDRTNDTAYRTLTVVDTTAPARHDVGVTAILAPMGTVDSGTVHTPQAVIRNFGTRQEQFRVTFLIGAGYAASVQRILIPNQTDTVMFPLWIAQPPDSYPTICFTSLDNDENRSNDTVCGSVVVSGLPGFRHDVGVTAILAPPDTVDSGSVLAPSARVANSGDRTETFPVTFRIGSAYLHTLPAVTLNPGDTATLFFPSWAATRTGSFVATCYTALAADENRANDTVYGSVVVVDTSGSARHDVAAVAIVAPTGQVHTNTAVVPVAVVQNRGTRPETFPVSMKVGSAYLGTVVCESLAVGATDTVRFAAWNAVSAGVEPVVLYTSLGTDENRANDTIVGSVQVVAADVSAIAILDPSGQLDSGLVVKPRAVVRNLGPDRAEFPVTMLIGTDRLPSVQLRLEPGAQDTVEFPLWVAQPVGDLSAVCFTSLAGDPNPANDTVRKPVRVRGADHDIGVEAVISPVGRTEVSGPPWAATVRPNCRVRNFSGTAESGFEVVCRIYSSGACLYDRTALVAALSPGGLIEVNFPDTVLGYGVYSVRCSTRLVTDQNPGNDAAEADYVVTARVGGPSQVAVKIYTRAGECVRRLERSVTEGSPPWIVWDRKNDQGRRVAAGVYLCRVTREGATDQGENGASTFNVLVSREAEEVRVMWRQP